MEICIPNFIKSDNSRLGYGDNVIFILNFALIVRHLQFAKIAVLVT